MILESVDLQELKNCQENNSSGYVMFVLPQIIAELEALRKVADASRICHAMEHLSYVENEEPTSEWMARLYNTLIDLDNLRSR
jgi:hypothetical protein